MKRPPEEVKHSLTDLPSEAIEYVFLSDKTILLANSYILHGAVTEKHLIDAQHIAIATIAHVDVLVSWNFKHIVNLDRIRKFTAVHKEVAPNGG